MLPSGDGLGKAATDWALSRRTAAARKVKIFSEDMMAGNEAFQMQKVVLDCLIADGFR